MSASEQAKTKMAAAIEHFKQNLKNIRTGRANPGMAEGILVEAYGSHVPLKTLATISAPDASQLLITPFDQQTMSSIKKGIEKANLGFLVIVDGHLIRLRVPPMTEEVRKKMVQVCYEELEKAKVSCRNIRRDANEAARKQKADGLIAEDALKKMEKTIQELTDKSCKEAQELCEKKEKEILTI